MVGGQALGVISGSHMAVETDDGHACIMIPPWVSPTAMVSCNY